MAGQESGVFGSTPDEWNALGDAQTRWREIASGVGGGGDASNSQPVPDVLSGFIISGGRGFSQDDSGDSFDGLVPAMDAHYYRGYWAGVQLAMYAPQPLPSAPAPYPIPGYGPNEPFPIPRANPLNPPAEVSKAVTSANNFPWGRREHIPWGTPFGGPAGPFDSVPVLPWPAPWDHPPWVQPEEWPQIVDPYTSASYVTPATSDVPTEQEILDAGNPALWLSPRLVGPTTVHGENGTVKSLFPSLSSSGPGPDDMTPVFPPAPTTSTLIPFDITPGDTISDVTP